MFDISRLQTQLNNTGLQNKDTPLYQFLNQLIGSIKSLNTDVVKIVSTSSIPSITSLTQILQSINLSDDFISDDSIISSNTQGTAQNISILFSGEVPAGLIDSSNKLFTTANTYLAGFIAVYLNGDRQIITGDYSETTSTSFTFVNAPTTGDIVLVDYIRVAGVLGTVGAAGASGATGSQGPMGPTMLVEDGLDGFDGYSIPSSGSGSGGSGALVLVEQKTASASAALNFTTGITATYDDYLFELINVVPATSTAELWMRFSTDGGSTFAITAYQYELRYTSPGLLTGILGSASDTHILLASGGANTASEGTVASIHFFTPGGAGSKRITFHVLTLGSDALYYDELGMGLWNSATAVNAVRFLMSAGNISSGTIRMYGIAKT